MLLKKMAVITNENMVKKKIQNKTKYLLKKYALSLQY